MDELPKILIVDDKRENLIALEATLKHLPIQIIKVSSGLEALTATLEHDFALALLDIQMPGMDGYELASILRERGRRGIPSRSRKDRGLHRRKDEGDNNKLSLQSDGSRLPA